MKNSPIILLVLTAILFSGCSKSLEKLPQGVVFNENLKTPENVEAMVISAYSALGNDHWSVPYTTMWAYGSVRGGDAYKGGGGTGDQNDVHAYELFSINRVDLGESDGTWFRLYVGVARCNAALALLNEMGDDVFPQKLMRTAEVRFLRAHFYFLLKVLFKRIPYIDESVEKSAYQTIGNDLYSNEELWTKIADDFRFAMQYLPVTQEESSRITKGAAQSYLAKTLLYQSYVQDEQHNVTSKDQAKLNEVVAYCDSVINSGRYRLSDDFAENFLSEYEKGPESVFAIVFSKSDGTPQGRINAGVGTNYPMNQEYGCCGFHQPSSNLVNAFKTNANGLPLLDNYNTNDIVPSGDFKTQSFDTRLDHTIAIPGHPYKYQKNLVFQASWNRDNATYGNFMSMKETVAYTDPTFMKYPPFMSSAKDWPVIRYADVLLIKAEALIELGREQEALPLINAIRQRAQKSAARLTQADGTATSSYFINTYQPGVNCVWSNDFARKALRFERRLEFAMEGYRFFDLVRWGIAAEFINDYFSVEQGRTPHLAGAAFKKNRDEYLPIPQNQINFSQGLYRQNFGW
ncbi:RagB/SusD family nutrient uptake outer membrane protein [Olivibacter domesticus]|uniref:Starch-binding associating with outer membrane n=1 Tax=Olivibacter domesticus TaxID=407022 RepID=A0A1H7WTT1_OLID1|nr:RagB/SusD family nutrient uptake outer membrane protein [Olivibacter domesticus]SEM24358.1 Starch-binding associating with outer membrane [Olivibacter domesticus]